MTDNFITRTIIPTPYGDQEVRADYILGLDNEPDIYRITPVFDESDDSEHKENVLNYINNKPHDCAYAVVNNMLKEKESSWADEQDNFRDE